MPNQELIEFDGAYINKQALLDRILQKSVVNPKTGCREWTGEVIVNGYGKISFGSRTKGKRRCVKAHRVHWMLRNHVLPRDIYVLHKCDNRLCVELDHLFIGTAADNTQDMFDQGRAHCQKVNKSEETDDE